MDGLDRWIRVSGSGLGHWIWIGSVKSVKGSVNKSLVQSLIQSIVGLGQWMVGCMVVCMVGCLGQSVDQSVDGLWIDGFMDPLIY